MTLLTGYRNRVLARGSDHSDHSGGRVHAGPPEHRDRQSLARDPLTGLLTRDALSDWFSDSFADRTCLSPVALSIDIDYFSDVNDAYGHWVGDAVLAEFAQRLSDVLGDSGVLARLSGDEFFAVVIDDSCNGELIARRLLRAVERPVECDGDSIVLSASIGYLAIGENESLDAVLRNAHRAMNHAKERGRANACNFALVSSSDPLAEFAMQAELRHAVKVGAIDVWGQKIYELDTGVVKIVELLARWNRTGGEAVSPAVFVPLIERMGLGAELGRFMLRQAAALLVAKPCTAPDDCAVSVNICAQHLSRCDLVADVRECFIANGGRPEQLIIELTESEVLDDIASVGAVFAELSSLGVRIAIDDFGAGYSSLGNLLSLPIDIVKIDGAVLYKASSHMSWVPVVRAVRDLALAIGCDVVAEGVETQGQHDGLQELGVTFGQGFHLARPGPIAELAA